MASSTTLSTTTSIGGNLQNMEKHLLGSNKDDAFRFLDTLLSVAASRWPQDLSSRRPQIMEKLYAPLPEMMMMMITTKEEEMPPPPPPPEKKKKKKKPCMIIRLKIPPALRASQATTTPDDQDDHRHHKVAAAEKEYSSVAPINKKKANKTAHDDHKNSKKIVRAASPDNEENSRLEASINKLNSQYRAAQINKRKIQAVEFQTQNKKKKKNNFITKLRQEAKKTKPTTKIAPTKKQFRRPPPHETLTSWIDAQTRRTQGGFW